MLTPEQVEHFNAFGFLVLRQVFTADEAETIERETTEIFDEARGGKPYAGEQEAIQPFWERRPFMAGLVADDRIYGLGHDILGPDFFLDVTEGWLHTGSTTWHGGGLHAEGLPHIKISFYIQPLTRETGALRVVPGSHIRGKPDLLTPLREQCGDPDFKPFGIAQSEIPSFPLESQPGDVTIFTESILHASFGGVDGRFQHALTWVRAPVKDEEFAQVRRSYETTRFSYRPCQSSIDSDNPRIRQAVKPLIDMGFEPHDL